VDSSGAWRVERLERLEADEAEAEEEDGAILPEFTCAAHDTTGA
jgi:hypothetical protein